MAYDPGGRNANEGLGSWIPILLMLAIFWPVGLILLFRKLAAPSLYRRKRHPYDIRREERAYAAAPPSGQAAPRQGTASGKKPEQQVKLPSGKGLTIGGGVIAAVFALGLVEELSSALLSGTLYGSLSSVFATLGFFCGGLVMAASGVLRSRKAKRFRKYLALIGKRDCITVDKLAGAMPVSRGRALDDLQEMLDKGYLSQGYLDYAKGMLVLNSDGLEDDKPEEPPQPAPDGMEQENAILQEIREVNDSISNPELSRKIDRVGEITGRIFDYLRKNPVKESQLRSFLNYYLPTTLKILRAYARMEAQGIEGENITAAKERIEGMMDKVADGFEKQLDQLFRDEAMDVTSDVAVLEQMLGKDGLSQDGGFQLGG